MNGSLLSELLTLIGPVIQTIESSATQGAAIAKLKQLLSSPLVQELEGIASVLFPALAPELQLLALLSSTSSNTTQLIQQALNIVIKPQPPLVVDGILGSNTKKAIMAWQKSVGLPITGFIADAEWALLQTALAKL
jgi:peptidoglycan hydrolase-like protein with peptidoglycan-binding domain